MAKIERTTRMVQVPPLDSNESYIETKYNIKPIIKIPEWWTEVEKEVWNCLDVMFRILKRYKTYWWSKPVSKPQTLLHEANQWQTNVVRWISMRVEDREKATGMLVHTFSIREVLTSCLNTPPNTKLVCNNIIVDYKEDRDLYIKNYNKIIEILRVLTK